MSKSWDSGILKKLKSLVGKGLSTAEIGKKLGISKNAVVGKLHRMGWNSGVSESAVEKGKKEPAKKAVGRLSAKKIAPMKPTGTTKTLKPIRSAKPVKVSPKVKETKKVVASAKKTSKTPADVKKVVGRPIATRGTNVHQRIVQHALEMANLKPNQCRWPIGDPDSEDFHFCGKPVFVGKPYCYEHCRQAYQFAPPKKK